MKAKTLKARLERMEQRITLLKHHNKPKEPNINCNSSYTSTHLNFNKSRGGSTSPLLLNDFQQGRAPHSRNNSKRHPLCDSNEEAQRKRPNSSSSNNNCVFANSSQTLVSSTNCELSNAKIALPVADSAVPADSVVQCASPVPSPAKTQRDSDCVHQNKKLVSPMLHPSKSSNETSKLDPMLTKQLYYLPETCDALSDIEQGAKEQSLIEVPSWKYHPVSSCYQLEGTENIDDDIFLKRHMKLEIDEKRRKRWDIQRIREIRHNEKLRRGRLAAKKGKGHLEPSPVNSFFWEPKDVQYIEVSDQVPVLAFGCTIPNIRQSDFTLSWHNEHSESVEESVRPKKPREPKTSSTKRGT